MRVKFIEKELEYMQCRLCVCARAWMRYGQIHGGTATLALQDAGVVQGECVGGGVEGSVTDSHLVPVARAARVVPLSAVVFDGLTCL